MPDQLMDLHRDSRSILALAELFQDLRFRDGRPVVVINQSAARRHWPGQSPIGRPAQTLVDHSVSPHLTSFEGQHSQAVNDDLVRFKAHA